MNSDIKKILEELYESDSSLKNHEKDLIELIHSFQDLKKDIHISPQYRNSLKKRLEERIHSYQNKQSFSYTSIFSTLFWWVALCSLLVFFYSDIYLSKQSTNYTQPLREEVSLPKTLWVEEEISNTETDTSTPPSWEIQKKQDVPIDAQKKPIISWTPLSPSAPKKISSEKLKNQNPSLELSRTSENKLSENLNLEKDLWENSSVSQFQWNAKVSQDTHETIDDETLFDPNLATILLGDAGRDDLVDEIQATQENQWISGVLEPSSDMSLKSSSPLLFSTESPSIENTSLEQSIYVYKISWDKSSFLDDRLYNFWSLAPSFVSQNWYFIVSASDIISVDSDKKEKEDKLMIIQLEKDPINLPIGEATSLRVIKGIVQNLNEKYKGPKEIYFQLD